MLRIAIECFFICLRNNYNYDQRLVFSFKSGDLPNKEFRINRDGDLVLDKALDFEIQTLFTFSVIVTDGVTNDEAEVSIRVLNVNDWNPEFRYPEYEFFVSDNRYTGIHTSVSVVAIYYKPSVLEVSMAKLSAECMSLTGTRWTGSASTSGGRWPMCSESPMTETSW